LNRPQREQGYALLLVLFAIVFITVITAVFMRGAISNATQGQTLDKNNLVVVSAEAGVDFYTWHLKQLYDEKQLEAEFTALVNGYITNKKAVDYEAIQQTIVRNFKDKLKKEASELTDSPKKVLFSKYTHKLTAATVNEEKNGDIAYLLVKGTVEGELPTEGNPKTKDLDFELRFIFPKVLTSSGVPPVDPGNDNNDTGSLITMPVLKAPSSPAAPRSPNSPALVSKPAAYCPENTDKIEGQGCFFNSLDIANYYVNKSSLFVENFLTSWQRIQIENSSVYVKNQLEAANLRIEDTNLTVGTSLKGNSSLYINKATVQAASSSNSADLQISNTDIAFKNNVTAQKSQIQSTAISVGSYNGGHTTFNKVDFTAAQELEVQTAAIENSRIQSNSYKAHSSATFSNTDLKIAATYQSGGASFSNSRVEIGKTMNFGGGLFTAEGSHVKVQGDVQAANGSRIYNSFITIGGSLQHTSTSFLAKNSDIFIGGDVSATNGTDFEHVNMIVNGAYTSSTPLKLDNTKLAIRKNISLGNGAELKNSQLTSSHISSSTTVFLKDDSIVATDYFYSDVLRMENSKVCAKEFNVRDLKMDGNSIVYYLKQKTAGNATFHSGKNIIQLPIDEYEKKCSIQTEETPNPPDTTGTIDWKAPVVDKVTY